MLTAAGPKIVEINGRLGGDFITTHLVQLGRGIEIIGEAIKSAVGDPIDLSARWEKASCVRFLISTREGRVRSWHGVDSTRRRPGIADVLIDREVGSPVRLPPKRYGEFRLAALISQAGSQEEALREAEIAAAGMSAELVPLEAV
jgi:biotin carboxylase